MSADRITTLNSQLTVAREKLAKLTAQRDAIVKRDAAVDWDPAMGSGIRRKPNPKADARRFNGYDRDAQVFKDYDDAKKEVAILERRLSDATTERDRHKFTRDEIVGATAVRTGAYGWRLVRRVNPTTVSIDSGYSWVTRVPFDDVLAVHKGEVKQ